MVKSKEWNWAEIKEKLWSEPSEDVYYYLNRWRKQGYKSFLDLGCGIGRHSLLFAENDFETYSLDLSQYAIDLLDEKAKELKLDIRTIISDINELPYEANKFDCLLAYHVISHTDSSGIKVIINEMNRVLKVGGEFFITLCSKNSPSFTQKNYPQIDDNTIIKTEGPEMNVPHYYSDLCSVQELLSDFEIIRIRHIEDISGDTSSWHYFIHGRKN